MRKVTLLLLAALSGCSRQTQVDKDKEPSKDEVVYVKSEDPGMTAAIAKAQATLDAFKVALAAPAPRTERYAVKVGFPYGKDNREHIWMKDPKFADASVTGRIMNEPVDVKDLKFGQIVTAPVKDISDWMYVEGGVLRGGYTMRVLLDKMSADERKGMIDEMGVRLE